VFGQFLGSARAEERGAREKKKKEKEKSSRGG
jgi:hypothetical protein